MASGIDIETAKSIKPLNIIPSINSDGSDNILIAKAH